MGAPPDALRRNAVTVMGDRTASETLVFVPGFGTDQTAWSDVASAFTPTHRVVLLDNVGAGRADPNAYRAHRYLSLQRWGDDLIEVLGAMDLPRGATLIGHSAGGAIALLAAVGAPTLVRQLVLLGASARYRDDVGYRGGMTTADIDAIYRAVNAGFESWADAFARDVVGNPDRPAIAAIFAESLKRMGSKQALSTLHAILTSDVRAELPRVSQRTLILQSRRDVIVPWEAAEYLQRSVTNSRLTVIDAEGHHPHRSAPQAVVQALREFLVEAA